MAISEVFSNPTVKTVIFQIRYPNLFFIESKIPEFQLKIMEKFPMSNLLINQQFVITKSGLDMQQQQSSDDNSVANKVWQFSSNEGYQLTLTLNSLAIQSTLHKTYNNPQGEHRFRDVIEYVLHSFFEIIPASIKLSRIGLRYVDECPLFEKTASGIDNNFNLISNNSRFPVETVSESFFRTVAQKGEYRIIYQETLTKNQTSNQYYYILDFDGFAEEISSKEALNITDQLHTIISDEYQASIKEPIYSYMRGEK